MATITGGITFERGKEVPQKFKDWVATNGVNTPFNPKTTTFSDPPKWLKLKGTDGKIYTPIKATISEL